MAECRVFGVSVENGGRRQIQNCRTRLIHLCRFRACRGITCRRRIRREIRRVDVIQLRRAWLISGEVVTRQQYAGKRRMTWIDPGVNVCDNPGAAELLLSRWNLD